MLEIPIFDISDFLYTAPMKWALYEKPEHLCNSLSRSAGEGWVRAVERRLNLILHSVALTRAAGEGFEFWVTCNFTLNPSPP